jgi:hypothetical protein
MEAPKTPSVVNPGGHGTHARCFFKPGLYVLAAQVIWSTVLPSLLIT